jgi:hypothetical protein
VVCMWCMVCGVCVVCGVRCAVCGVWCVVCGVWCVVCVLCGTRPSLSSTSNLPVLGCVDIDDVAVPLAGCANDVLCPVSPKGPPAPYQDLLRGLALEVFAEYQGALWGQDVQRSGTSFLCLPALHIRTVMGPLGACWGHVLAMPFALHVPHVVHV